MTENITNRIEFKVNLPSDIVDVLNKLANEDEISLEKAISDLIGAEDANRHLKWDPKAKTFIRRNCGRAKCLEPEVKIPPHYGA